MKKYIALAAALALSPVAAGQSTQNIFLNGQEVKAVSVTVDGEPAYQIKLADLQRAEALTEGGSTAREYNRGCVGQNVFNGVLKVKLLEAQLNGDDPFVRFEVTNGSPEKLNPAFDDNGDFDDGLYLADDEGQTLELGSWREPETPNRQLPSGSSLKASFNVNAKDLYFTPTRILWIVDEKYIDQDLPWAKVKNMEFSLNCKQ